MGEIVEKYLTNLERRLARKLPPFEVQEHLIETRAHLSDSSMALAAEGDASPEMTALKRLGSDKLLAEELIRARRGLSSMPSWRIALAPAVTFVFAAMVEIAVSYMRVDIPRGIQPVLEGLLLVPLVLLIVAVVRSRKLLWGSNIAAFGILISFVICVESIWGHFGISQGSANKRYESVKGFQDHISQLNQTLAQAKAYSADKPISSALRRGSFYLSPVAYQAPSINVSYFGIPVHNGTKAFSTLREVSSEHQARQDWAKSGHLFVSYTEGELREAKKSLQEWRETKLGAPLMLLMLKNLSLVMAPVAITVCLLNLITLGLLSVRTKMLKVFWQPERLAT